MFLVIAVIAQVVEHVLGKNEVIGANPINGSLGRRPRARPADVAVLVGIHKLSRCSSVGRAPLS